MTTNFLTVCIFLFSTANVSSRQLEAETIDMFIYHPLTSIYEVMFIHPDLNCEYQNKVLIIYTLFTTLLTPPSWSLYSFIKINPPSKQFICLHIKIPYLHDKSPQQQKCNVFFMFVMYTWWNACWASLTTSLTWNSKNTSTSGNSRLIKKKKKQSQNL